MKNSCLGQQPIENTLILIIAVKAFGTLIAASSFSIITIINNLNHFLYVLGPIVSSHLGLGPLCGVACLNVLLFNLARKKKMFKAYCLSYFRFVVAALLLLMMLKNNSALMPLLLESFLAPVVAYHLVSIVKKHTSDSFQF